jgi:hypothetical protein
MDDHTLRAAKSRRDFWRTGPFHPAATAIINTFIKYVEALADKKGKRKGPSHWRVFKKTRGTGGPKINNMVHHEALCCELTTMTTLEDAADHVRNGGVDGGSDQGAVVLYRDALWRIRGTARALDFYYQASFLLVKIFSVYLYFLLSM